MFAARRQRFSAVLVLLLAVLGLCSRAQQFDPALYEGMRWRMIGPFRAGRTVAISGVPGQPNVFFMAPNNGGVWKTTDYGHTWQPLFDRESSGSVGALAVSPSDPKIIYVGSGEGLRRPDLSVGNGIYKSTDGGQTWQHLGLSDAQQIGAILVDPGDSNRVFAAAVGHPYGPNDERGIFRSLDGGATWQKVLYKNSDTGAIDLVFDPRNAQTIYGVLWASRRPPWTTGGSYNASGAGLYKSVDGGSTWHELGKGLPTGADLGRIGVTIAPSDSSRMYALVESRKAGGVYRSDDAGENWQRVNSEERVYGRGDDFACVRVHPKDRDTIYVANTSTYASTDAGKTFTAIKGAPGGDDYHTIWINPDDPAIIAMAVDQGATISVNGGQTWSSWYNQPTAQFYHVITDNQFPYWVYGGQQESGSVGTASRSDFGEITFRDWYPVGVEEYGYVAPDPLDPNMIYGGKVTRFNRTTGQTQDVSPFVLRTGKYRFNRTAPLVFSAADPHALYLGSNVLFKTTDGGNSWQEISPDLTREAPGIPTTLGVFVDDDPAKGKHRGVIYSIAPSPKDANLIWIGTDDGQVQVTRDGGKTWLNVTPADLTAWSKLAQMDASHFDSATVYAAVNRFRLDDLHPYIYRTHDGGRSWQKITTGIPDDEPVNTVREDPDRKGLLFAGTEHTVYVSLDDGDHWQSLRLNLPATSIRDLVIHQDDVVIGTHGRSFWILDNITSLRQMSAAITDSDSYLYAPQVTYRVRRNNNTDTPLPPEIPAGQNPPDGAMLEYWLKTSITGPVTLQIADADGKVVRKFSSDDKAAPVEADLNVPTYWIRPERTLSRDRGMHRFIWDLRYPPPDSLEHEYPISAIYRDTPRYPLGPAVLPGEYTVTLSAGGKVSTQKLTLKMDPRVKTQSDGLKAQFDLAQSITGGMHQSYEALSHVRAVRERIHQLQKDNKAGGLTKALDALDKQTSLLEGTSGGYGAGFLSSPESRGFARINTAFYNLLSIVDSADVAPTTQAVAMTEQVKQALSEQLKSWDTLRSADLSKLNGELKRRGLQPIDPDATSSVPMDEPVAGEIP